MGRAARVKSAYHSLQQSLFGSLLPLAHNTLALEDMSVLLNPARLGCLLLEPGVMNVCCNAPRMS